MNIGYARVSTGDQHTEAQLPALKEANCKRIYQEDASGRDMARPELEKCLERLEPGDTLVIWRLDRLGRSIRDLLEIIDRISKAGIHFRSLTESFDTTTAAGRLIFHFFAALTQFELEVNRERTMIGLSHARARGRLGGRKPKLSAQQARQVRLLWADKSTTKKEIAAQYNVSVGTIDRIVRPKSLKL